MVQGKRTPISPLLLYTITTNATVTLYDKRGAGVLAPIEHKISHAYKALHLLFKTEPQMWSGGNSSCSPDFANFCAWIRFSQQLPAFVLPSVLPLKRENVSEWTDKLQNEYEDSFFLKS